MGEVVYLARGEDGSRYGPANLDELKQWVSETRIIASTQLENALTNEVVAAHTLRELGLTPPASIPSYSAYPGAGAVTPGEVSKARVVAPGESKEWLWSLLIGLAACVVGVFIGIAGIFLGITAIQKALAAHQDRDTLKAIPGFLLGIAAIVIRFTFQPILL